MPRETANQYSRAFTAIPARGVVELAALLATVLADVVLHAVTRVAQAVNVVLAPAVLVTVLVEAVVDCGENKTSHLL